MRLASIRRNGIQHLETPGELPGIAGKQYLFTRRQPRINAAYRSLLISQPPGDIARGWHNIHFAGTLFAPNEGQLRAIRRKTRIADLAHASCKTFGAPALARN